jgi:hypothetical protein
LCDWWQAHRARRLAVAESPPRLLMLKNHAHGDSDDDVDDDGDDDGGDASSTDGPSLALVVATDRAGDGGGEGGGGGAAAAASGDNVSSTRWREGCAFKALHELEAWLVVFRSIVRTCQVGGRCRTNKQTNSRHFHWQAGEGVTGWVRVDGWVAVLLAR